MSTISKLVIRLWEHVGTGLIIQWQSGIEYSNQVMGTSCAQMSAEGVFVPIGNDVILPSNELISPENDLFKYFKGPPHCGSGAQAGLSEEDAIFIETCLHKDHGLQNISVDRKLLRKSCGAWVHVVVNEPLEKKKSMQTYQGFGPFPVSGILTWTNTD